MFPSALHVVTRSCSMRRRTSTGSKRPVRQTVFAPAASIMTAPAYRPERWNSGTVTSEQVGGGGSLPGAGVAPLAAAASICFKPLAIAHDTNPQMPRCELTAPFGRPVVPLVEQDDRGIVLADRIRRERRIRRVGEQSSKVVLDLHDWNAEIVARNTRQPLAIGHEHLRFAVLESVQDLVGLPPAIERHRDRPEAHRRPERDQPLGVVLREDRHAIPGPTPYRSRRACATEATRSACSA